MEIELKESNVEVIIKCTKVELEHFAKGLKDSSIEDGCDDCNCGENDCYLCKGYNNFIAIRKEIMKVANVQPIVRKKSSRKRIPVNHNAL